MEIMLQLQEALGSLIDIDPEPKKVKRRTHRIKLLYDSNNSDVSSAWADAIYEISNSYDFLVKESDEHYNKSKLLNDYLKSYENNIDLGSRLSLNKISAIVNECDENCNIEHSNQTLLKDIRKAAFINE